jgi:pyruvate carboxylase
MVVQEMVISAPHAGKVGHIQIREGDSVGGADLICKIEKP